MIVVTTPTGNVGGQLLPELLDAETEPLRVVVRDPSRLPDAVRHRVQVIVGSHDDPAALDQALDGAQGLFWLIPPSMRASSANEYYLSFARPAVAAIRRYQVGHVVGISSAGWDFPHPAGLLSAAHAMDAELETSGAAYRSLGMGFYMENLLRPLPRMISDGVLSMPLSPDRPLAVIATQDIAAVAAGLLLDRSWEGPATFPSSATTSRPTKWQPSSATCWGHRSPSNKPTSSSKQRPRSSAASPKGWQATSRRCTGPNITGSTTKTGPTPPPHPPTSTHGVRPCSPQQPATSHEDAINNAPRDREEQPALACPSPGPESMLLVLVSNRAPLTCFRSLTGISTRTP
jgi:uncharacterized protein YbjT (DUF2867 family)